MIVVFSLNSFGGLDQAGRPRQPRTIYAYCRELCAGSIKVKEPKGSSIDQHQFIFATPTPL